MVLFLADTFRADNLAAYGSELGLTPALDRFAEESLCFTRAWAPSSWTLPSHASLFTGLYPHQHGAAGPRTALAPGAVTLAEHLAAAGYRTGAITDGAFVSAAFGLDQGFAWFDEGERELDETLDEVDAFLAAGDGRPTFLFVQTYRVHEPYRASPRTRGELAGRLPIAGDWPSLSAELYRNPWQWEQGEPIPPGMRPLVADLERLYRGGVADLDRGFGRFLGILERHGVDARGYTIFTSDHGEAFGEHDVLFHRTGVWEEHVRIPLLIRGPDLEPGRVEHAASLVDLPQTVAELVDLAPAPAWGGRSLVSAREDGAVFSFQCDGGEDSSMALIEGTRKLIVPEALGGLAEGVSPQRAYDLQRDPGETVNRSAESWSADLHARLASRVREISEPHVAPDEARLGADEEARLEDLGYTGD